ncbi:MAG: hypothetical protein EA404_02825 [Spirochaetaceae bacterium]|nr:MAG: hypothetical protein EA404_02825 [Spirochaetaceae bacterium]
MNLSTRIRDAFKQSNGILRLAPNFVPRRFARAGCRLRLHPNDYYALGTARGSIKERWFSSVIPAMNGELAAADEGLSYVTPDDNSEHRFLLKDAVAELGSELIGTELMQKFGTWPMYSKFFDYETPLFHHLHLDFDKAAAVGMLAKPEAYYFPPQLNNHLGSFPVTYFGYDPDVSLEEVVERLLRYEADDNRITELSRAYRIELGTGWYTPPGVVHAPGSVLTYEPQWNADVNSVHENVTSGEVYPYDFLVENCPPDKKRDIDYIVSLMDWEKNIDPHYRKTYFRPPVAEHEGEDYSENWVVYGNPYFGAKELTVPPGGKAVVEDQAAYGCILVQGFGSFGGQHAETATMLRFGQLSADEYFVSEACARAGVEVLNHSRCEPMVILKHFGPNHPKMP